MKFLIGLCKQASKVSSGTLNYDTPTPVPNLYFSPNSEAATCLDKHPSNLLAPSPVSGKKWILVLGFFAVRSLNGSH